MTIDRFFGVREVRLNKSFDHSNFKHSFSVNDEVTNTIAYNKTRKLAIKDFRSATGGKVELVTNRRTRQNKKSSPLSIPKPRLSSPYFAQPEAPFCYLGNTHPIVKAQF